MMDWKVSLTRFCCNWRPNSLALLSLAFMACCNLQPAPVWAQLTGSSTDHTWLLQRFDEQDARIRQLEEELRQTAAFRLTAGESSAANVDPDARWEDVSNEKWTHNVGGRLLMETVMWPDNDNIPGAVNYAQIRQVRLAMRGTGYGVLDYRIQLDFEPEVRDTDGGVTRAEFGSVGMKDLYVGIHEIPFLRYVRFGHFKVSFSHDQMLGRRDMTYMERFPMADPNGFTPGRELGVQAYNYSANERATWQFGAYYDSISELGKQRIDFNQGLVANIRGTWLPVYDEPSGGRYVAHLGLGYIYTRPQDGSGRFSQRPEIHEGPVLIDTGAIAADDYSVLGTEVLLHWGSVFVNHELMWAHVNAAGGDIDLYSGYIEAGWRLTGEHRNYDRRQGFFTDLVPYENFWLVQGCHGLGAWEVAARWSFVDFSEAPNDSRYDSLNLALNWYWNSRTRVQMNWIMPHVSGAPLGNRSPNILGLRLAAYF